MTTFLRLLAEDDKAAALLEVCTKLREEGRSQGAEEGGRSLKAEGRKADPRIFEVAPSAFDAVPGKPFAYWVSKAVRDIFKQLPRFESGTRIVRQGGVTGNDERYLRLWWESSRFNSVYQHWQWIPFAKGGSASRWYSDFPVITIWDFSRGTFGGFTGLLHRPSEKPSSANQYFKGGLTWPLRAENFVPIPLPKDSIFSIRGYAILSDSSDLLFIAAMCNSTAFDYIFKVALGRFGFPEFVVGILQILPFPEINKITREILSELMRVAWSLKRTLDTVNETSHAFLLSAALRPRLGNYDPFAIQAELAKIQTEIDDIAFDLYEFSEADRKTVMSGPLTVDSEEQHNADEDDETNLPSDFCLAPQPSDFCLAPQPSDFCLAPLLSWSVGVAFGRFDIHLAIGEREAPPESDPFDPLPAKSPGMLPDGSEPFHHHDGLLVDDPGHQHDLTRLVEEVLDAVMQAEGARQKPEGRAGYPTHCLLPRCLLPSSSLLPPPCPTPAAGCNTISLHSISAAIPKAAAKRPFIGSCPRLRPLIRYGFITTGLPVTPFSKCLIW